VVFHTTALLASGVYLVTMGLAGYYVRDYGGSWGLVAQAFFLFVTILTLLLFLFSRRIRARWKVLLNKHLYPYKYDYREEWLRFIKTISTVGDDTNLYLKTIKSIAQIIDSPGGMLWLKKENGFDYVHPDDIEHVQEKFRTVVEGKTVLLEKDISETDRYNRLLRYVWLDGELINEVLVREGYANSSTYPPDIIYQDRFNNAEQEAREKEVGLWSDICKITPTTAPAPTKTYFPLNNSGSNNTSDYSCNCN